MELFRAAEETKPISFIGGNILDDDFLDPSPNLESVPQFSKEVSLTNLESLSLLRGRVSAIHASMFFHLFSESDQLRIAEKLATLLSPVPGSIIFGNHIALAEAGIHPRNTSGIRMFCHSPQTWREMWEKVFPKGTIEVYAELVMSDEMQPSKSAGENTNGYYGNDTDDRWENLLWLVWSIKRL